MTWKMTSERSFTFILNLITVYSILLIVYLSKWEVSSLKNPDIFILGERKCATTSLRYVLMHGSEEICNTWVPEGKGEMHYFDTQSADKFNYTLQHNNYYDKHFSKCGDKLTIDDTPGLIRQISAYDRMRQIYTKKQLRKKKFVVLFREPTAAVVSWYKHRIRNCTAHVKHYITYHKPDIVTNSSRVYTHKGLCDHWGCSDVGCKKIALEFDTIRTDDITEHFNSFEEYIREWFPKHMNDYDFLGHIKLWSEAVGRQNIFVINFDTIVNPKTTPMVMEGLRQFLGLKNGFGDDVELPRENESGEKVNIPIDCKSFDNVRRIVSDMNKGFEDFINNSSAKKSKYEPKFVPFKTKRDCEG